jgi:hypothetical protein
MSLPVAEDNVRVGILADEIPGERAALGVQRRARAPDLRRRRADRGGHRAESW